jgi:sacsin
MFGALAWGSEAQGRLLETTVVIVPQMYRILFDGMGEGLEDVRRVTLGQDWVWVGDRYVSTSKLCFGTPVNARPYMYQLPHELRGNLGDLFRRLGVRTDATPLDFAELLADLAREAPGQPLQPKALDVSIALIQYLSDRAGELHGSCYVPSDKGILVLGPHLVFDDAPWLSRSEEFRKKHQFVHPKLSNDVAEKLGIKSLRSFLIESTSQSLGLKIENAEAFGQTESLTRRLRNILALYPEGPGVLYEMIQNADVRFALHTPHYTLLPSLTTYTRTIPHTTHHTHHSIGRPCQRSAHHVQHAGLQQLLAPFAQDVGVARPGLVRIQRCGLQ